MDDPFFWNDCDPGIAETVKSAVDALTSEGAVLRPMTLPEATEAYAVFLEGGLSARLNYGASSTANYLIGWISLTRSWYPPCVERRV